MDNLPGQRTIKRFRVAREGQTVDGRSISREQILDMAQTYNPVEYTARINVEHMGGWNLLGNTAYPALGDVIAADAKLEKFNINGVEVELMCLYATLSALPQLIEANKKGEKIFCSIEFYPKFADTGRAYLVGLAVTDIPASRGLEPLKFNKKDDNTLLSAPQELELMSAQTPTPNTSPTVPTTEPTNLNQPAAPNHIQKDNDSFLSKLSNIFASKPTGMSTSEQDAILQAFNQIKEQQQQQLQKFSQQQQQLLEKFNQLQGQFTALENKLNLTPAAATTTPPVGTGDELTQY